VKKNKTRKKKVNDFAKNGGEKGWKREKITILTMILALTVTLTNPPYNLTMARERGWRDGRFADPLTTPHDHTWS